MIYVMEQDNSHFKEGKSTYGKQDKQYLLVLGYLINFS